MKNILHIKNMVCPRCISSVSRILEDMNISYRTIKLGEVQLDAQLENEDRAVLSKKLNEEGFSIINNRKAQLIERMKNLVVKTIHHSNEGKDVIWAKLISNEFHLDYKYLSSLFSSVEGITLEQFIINQKIERIKELIVYDELTLSEIAFKLNYSSVAYLSNQFKKLTGMPPSKFKKSTNQNRKSLDEI
ncbi:MAG: AraC family transcriptional regulator [Leeuwenhoekiella sp.]|nr:AraC family transcriptional regulator [Leeuwenhoekiella sp.]